MNLQHLSAELKNWHTQARNHPLPCDPFTRKSVRSALRLWDNSRKLGEHSLARLKVVETRRQAALYADNPAGRGLALRDILHDALKTLRPATGTLDHTEKCWRSYIILKEQYVEGRSPDYLATQLSIERSTYNHEQANALDALADLLRQWEYRKIAGSTTAGTALGYLDNGHVPFLAPTCPPHTLVGRNELLQNLKRQLFANDGLALAALSGLPGVGKTALAIELANDPEVLSMFKDGVLWANLGQKPDLFALLGAWCTAVGIPLNAVAKLARIEDQAQAIHTAIGMRRMLLVIDDAWQINQALLLKLGGHNCAHLLTTRVPEIALEFAGKAAMKVLELGQDEGLALLTELAAQAVETRPDEAKVLVQAVGGLPLALVLTGKHLRKECYSNHPRRLHRALEELRRAEARLQLAHPQTVPERYPGLPANAPTSLLAAIQVTDGALSGISRRALRALSVFPPKPNTFSEEAALAVSAVPPEALDSLIDYGLMEGRAGRYTLHPVIADYGRIELADKSTYKRMVQFFVGYIEAHQTDHHALHLEIDNILAALQIAFDLRMQVELVRIADAFSGFLEARGLYAQAAVLLKRIQQAIQPTGGKAVLVTMLYSLEQIARMQCQIY